MDIYAVNVYGDDAPYVAWLGDDLTKAEKYIASLKAPCFLTIWKNNSTKSKPLDHVPGGYPPVLD